ncbi:hypothetical protein POSPLADRAFT_1042614 [Postia placenta MAD-698-R-SB12]|uniref:EamA domain-containing protein n=1 Tax=Postia placenta MAD-698-R-SB12 TaxID=670580 RepID=A0A1X6NFT8_9APHY|nr:hypothetical protein POSPLADRAFT_1042614 [Postia placenta MAD-698-R-SB12]OSX67390.1 hypothetical protein POSPLADRAFT_1042614 [Postia placenta MAD-698-R-SB12]
MSAHNLEGNLYHRDYIIGIVLLLIVVVLWTSSNFLTQDLFEDGYEKPFLVTYLNTSAFAFYLIPYAIKKSITGGSTSADDSNELLPLTTKETAQLAASFCFLWFIANWTVNASLDYTSVASATILSSMSGFFTLAIGRVFRVETLTLVKIGAVATSFIGVVLVSASDSSQTNPGPPAPSSSLNPDRINSMTMFAYVHILGDALALLSALFYALYVTLLKVRIRSESRIDMQLFFGFVGLFNILTCWPIGILLHITGVERFEMPYTSKAVLALLINMGITLSSDYIYVIAMLKTTPLVVTIGLSLTMPLAVLGDFVLGKPAKIQVIVGAAVVLCSFILVGLEDAHNAEEPDLLTGRIIEEGQDEGGVRLEEEVAAEP